MWAIHCITRSNSGQIHSPRERKKDMIATEQYSDLVVVLQQPLALAHNKHNSRTRNCRWDSSAIWIHSLRA